MTEDEVFDRVCQLISAGEYQDTYWRVERGSAEYAVARDGGGLVRLPPLPLASPEAVAEAENVIGYPLPRLLRRLYLEAGNGGFGPHAGILGVRGGISDGNWQDLVQLHRESRAGPDDPWSPWHIGLFDWGCAIWSLVDCRDPPGHRSCGGVAIKAAIQVTLWD